MRNYFLYPSMNYLYKLLLGMLQILWIYLHQRLGIDDFQSSLQSYKSTVVIDSSFLLPTSKHTHLFPKRHVRTINFVKYTSLCVS